MATLQELVKKIQKFYDSVELHESDIQNWIENAKKPLRSIINQSIFYRAVVAENSVVNTPFEEIKDFREALIENILESLQNEYNYLEQIRNNINSANEKLQEKQISLENLFTDLVSQDAINSTFLSPCCPSLEHIIEWSHSIWCYYHSYYLQISQALAKLNYENETSVICLKQSFNEDTELKKQINKIRSFKFFRLEFIL